jgi:hypothetical protein
VLFLSVFSMCEAFSAAAANSRASVIEGNISALIAANSSNIAASIADADAAAAAAQIGRLVSSSCEAFVSALIITSFIACAVPFFVYITIMVQRLLQGKGFFEADELSLQTTRNLVKTSLQQQRNAVAARVIDIAAAEQVQLKRKVRIERSSSSA